MAFKMRGFPMHGTKSAFKQTPTGTQTTDSKVIDKEKEMEISIKKMINNPNWKNEGKKKSDYTPEQYKNIKNPTYQALLSKMIGEKMESEGVKSGESGGE